MKPICCESGTSIFIGTEYDAWNMDPGARKKAFELHPDVKRIIAAHLDGRRGKIDEIRAIAGADGALIAEDAAES